jgi:hypothetical protein
VTLKVESKSYTPELAMLSPTGPGFFSTFSKVDCEGGCALVYFDENGVRQEVCPETVSDRVYGYSGDPMICRVESRGKNSLTVRFTATEVGAYFALPTSNKPQSSGKYSLELTGVETSTYAEANRIRDDLGRRMKRSYAKIEGLVSEIESYKSTCRMASAMSKSVEFVMVEYNQVVDSVDADRSWEAIEAFNQGVGKAMEGNGATPLAGPAVADAVNRLRYLTRSLDQLIDSVGTIEDQLYKSCRRY